MEVADTGVIVKVGLLIGIMVVDDEIDVVAKETVADFSTKSELPLELRLSSKSDVEKVEGAEVDVSIDAAPFLEPTDIEDNDKVNAEELDADVSIVLEPILGKIGAGDTDVSIAGGLSVRTVALGVVATADAERDDV